VSQAFSSELGSDWGREFSQSLCVASSIFSIFSFGRLFSKRAYAVCPTFPQVSVWQ
jgi:hypothetical protein